MFLLPAIKRQRAGAVGTQCHGTLSRVERRQEVFEAFFLCFFPTWGERFEFIDIDWLDKELFLAPPQGEKRQLDLVAKLRLRPGAPPPRGVTDLVALVHVELESRASTLAFRPRMFDYYIQLRATPGYRSCPSHCSFVSGSTASAGTPTKNTSGNSGSFASSTPTSVCPPSTASRTRWVRTCWGSREARCGYRPTGKPSCTPNAYESQIRWLGSNPRAYLGSRIARHRLGTDSKASRYVSSRGTATYRPG